MKILYRPLSLAALIAATLLVSCRKETRETEEVYPVFNMPFSYSFPIKHAYYQSDDTHYRFLISSESVSGPHFHEESVRPAFWVEMPHSLIDRMVFIREQEYYNTGDPFCYMKLSLYNDTMSGQSNQLGGIFEGAIKITSYPDIPGKFSIQIGANAWFLYLPSIRRKSLFHCNYTGVFEEKEYLPEQQ